MARWDGCTDWDMDQPRIRPVSKYLRESTCTCRQAERKHSVKVNQKGAKLSGWQKDQEKRGVEMWYDGRIEADA